MLFHQFTNTREIFFKEMWENVEHQRFQIAQLIFYILLRVDFYTQLFVYHCKSK